MPETIKWKAWVDFECRYILENFHGDRGPRTGTATTLWGHRLITHDKPLREIAECAKEVFKAHENCSRDRLLGLMLPVPTLSAEPPIRLFGDMSFQ
ncbi:hypothetical protein D6C77_03453 [Aureobasidium pullulans]|uniref:Uncharacterized protein n=1 Tax=Aureobasidium pullulans TaxID=5580 RepID=A0A4S9E878_AURPU|nr:hypothetical protein D6D15_00200 [Aureobasidium pullulans]THX30295.1 hypothetical protein D6D12_03604 [Aureobasidium pullulans]THX56427.1 hypothetical protein D6D11_03513 [Aureobasidium pullulans]THY50299.1 hypothetical protein D6C99_04836 [Aureobasidium pullulans]TIA61460.1 hypothetical protein D6C77_03453 [Aureobasidium pullulans]